MVKKRGGFCVAGGEWGEEGRRGGEEQKKNQPSFSVGFVGFFGGNNLGLSYFFFWYASARAQIFGNPKIKNKK